MPSCETRNQRLEHIFLGGPSHDVTVHTEDSDKLRPDVVPQSAALTQRSPFGVTQGLSSSHAPFMSPRFARGIAVLVSCAPVFHTYFSETNTIRNTADTAKEGSINTFFPALAGFVENKHDMVA